MPTANEPRQFFLTLLNRRPAQILAIQLDQIEGAQDGIAAMTGPADQVEHREAVVGKPRRPRYYYILSNYLRKWLACCRHPNVIHTFSKTGHDGR